MNKKELLKVAYQLLSGSKTAVLSTVSADGRPKMRWMSPVFLKNSYNLYAITSNRLSKISDLRENNNVQWMLQESSLKRILTIEGQINIVEDLSLRAEVLEAVGNQLSTFWTINKDPSSLVVLETEIKSAVLFEPVKGTKQLIVLEKEDDND